MKIRSGFVSNSSSSSFIVIGVKPPEDKVNSVLLDPITAAKVIKRVSEDEYRDNDVKWDGKQPVYLTQYLSDCGSYTEPFEDVAHYSYCSGEHGQMPYSWNVESKREHQHKVIFGKVDEDSYHTDAVFIRKDDLPVKKRASKKTKI